MESYSDICYMYVEVQQNPLIHKTQHEEELPTSPRAVKWVLYRVQSCPVRGIWDMGSMFTLHNNLFPPFLLCVHVHQQIHLLSSSYFQQHTLQQFFFVLPCYIRSVCIINGSCQRSNETQVRVRVVVASLGEGD